MERSKVEMKSKARSSDTETWSSTTVTLVLLRGRSTAPIHGTYILRPHPTDEVLLKNTSDDTCMRGLRVRVVKASGFKTTRPSPLGCWFRPRNNLFLQLLKLTATYMYNQISNKKNIIVLRHYICYMTQQI